MRQPEVAVQQAGAAGWVIEKLPDGSTAVYDSSSKTVHSLNQCAAAAFEACREKKTVPQLAQAMEELLDSPVTDETALASVHELEQAGLVVCSNPVERETVNSARRALLRAAAIAIPVVLSLTAGEQKAYAFISGSGDA